MDLVDFKTTFDGVMQKYVDEKITQAKNHLDNKTLNTIIQYVQTFIFSGGKRLRPYCLRAVYMWLGGQDEKAIMQVGIILELFHSMALMHDDIIDQADKRHNAPTMHRYVAHLLWDKPSASHVWESQAILIGDLLLAWVYELRNKMKWFSPEAMDDAKRNIHEMIEEVLFGQMIDVNMMISWPASMELIDKKNMYKTASYTFIRPMLTGAILANATEEQKTYITELGRRLGLAFQVRDDLFDLTGGDKTKSIFSDVQEGQQTYFTNYIFTKGTPEDQKLLSECLGKKLDEQKISELQNMFKAAGAIDFGKQMVADFIGKAREVFPKIPGVSPAMKRTFDELIKRLERVS